VNRFISNEYEIIISESTFEAIKNVHISIIKKNKDWKLEDTLELLVRYVSKNENEKCEIFDVLGCYFVDKPDLLRLIGAEILQSIHSKTEIFPR